MNDNFFYDDLGIFIHTKIIEAVFGRSQEIFPVSAVFFLRKLFHVSLIGKWDRL